MMVKKRLIAKIPKELGGDNQYQLFNKPGITLEDFSGFCWRINSISIRKLLLVLLQQN
jgi:hypothetical protein